MSSSPSRIVDMIMTGCKHSLFSFLWGRIADLLETCSNVYFFIAKHTKYNLKCSFSIIWKTWQYSKPSNLTLWIITKSPILWNCVKCSVTNLFMLSLFLSHVTHTNPNVVVQIPYRFTLTIFKHGLPFVFSIYFQFSKKCFISGVFSAGLRIPGE